MTNLTNSMTEFAVTEDGRVFSYETGRHYLPEGLLVTPTGTWDLATVKANILAGLPVSIAFTPAVPGAPDPALAPMKDDKVAKANEDFTAAIDGLTEKPAETPPKPDAAA